jgi:hypothetical protein
MSRLHPVLCRLVLGCCVAFREQFREHRVPVPSGRGRLRRSGPPRPGPIGRPSMARPMQSCQPIPAPKSKHGSHVTSGDVAIPPSTLALAVIAYRLLPASCRVFAACSPPAARLAWSSVTIPRRSWRIVQWQRGLVAGRAPMVTGAAGVRALRAVERRRRDRDGCNPAMPVTTGETLRPDPSRPRRVLRGDVPQVPLHPGLAFSPNDQVLGAPRMGRALADDRARRRRGARASHEGPARGPRSRAALPGCVVQL